MGTGQMHADRWTDTTKLIGSFRDYANTLTNGTLPSQYHKLSPHWDSNFEIRCRHEWFVSVRVIIICFVIVRALNWSDSQFKASYLVFKIFIIRVFGPNRPNRYKAAKWLVMDGKTGARIILFITGLRPALWPTVGEQVVQPWGLICVLFHSYQVSLPGDKMASL
jgi:hypothetical protein